MKLKSNKYGKFSNIACQSLLEYLQGDFKTFQQVIEYSFLNCAIKLNNRHFEKGILQSELLSFLDCDESIARLSYAMEEYDQRVSCAGLGGCVEKSIIEIMKG